MRNKDIKILRIKEVCAKVGVAKSTLYVMIQEGEFLEPVRIGKRNIGWRNVDVDEWLLSLPTIDPSEYKGFKPGGRNA